MPGRRSADPAPPPALDPRGRFERRALGALRATGGPGRVRIGRPVRVDDQVLDPATQAMLELRRRMRYPSWHEQTVAAARDTIRHEALVAAGRPMRVAAAEALRVDGAAGPLDARLYRPGGIRNPAGTWQPVAERPPLIVFLHGGGFVLGDLDSHDALCRLLCRRMGAVVLAVAYRLAPEHPWPAAPDDALAAWRWAVAHAAELGADPDRIGVAGDSAGGNLSAIVAQQSTRAGEPSPALQLLFYPTVDWAGEYGSRERFATGFYLERESMEWCEHHYLGGDGTGVDLTDPRLSPLRADDLSGLPPAVIATAGFDPLRDEGEAYAAALRAAGTPVVVRRMPDLIHGFANTLGVGRRSREATIEVAALGRGLLEVQPGRSRPAEA
ncbi:alpha/beta hydrolase [Patulibacter defluvii]|uniref:alpha/beta hydrolase n=1 Tax=Patulibacter defluvii TaxID=3095358 RepID=UPI002A75467C|nr:alpha/beta hydrolase [Patulibacter sp. DM4]